jgi:hypothetical protein
MLRNFTVLLVLWCCFACNWAKTGNASQQEFQQQTNAYLDSLQQNMKPIYGYRFRVSGDFNGDGQQEVITERYFSQRDQRETNKYYEGAEDYFVQLDSASKKKNITYLAAEGSNIDSLFIDGVLGLLFLKNEGDLNGDGSDELSYVASKGQISSKNECHIMSCKGGEWRELYAFEIREWQLPPTPDGGRIYGVYSNAKPLAEVNPQEAESLLNKFSEWIEKLGDGTVRIHTFGPFSVDTSIVVNLKS